MKKTLFTYLFLLVLTTGCINIFDNESIEVLEVKSFQYPSIEWLEVNNPELSLQDILSDSAQFSFDTLQATMPHQRDKVYWLRADFSDLNLSETEEWVLRTGNFSVNNVYTTHPDSGIQVSKSGNFDAVQYGLENLNWRYHVVSPEELFEGKYVYVKLIEPFFARLIYKRHVAAATYTDFTFISLRSFLESAAYQYRSILFLGGIAFLLVYTFGIYFVYKESLYLLYGIYLIFLLMYLGVKMYPGFSVWMFGSHPVYNHVWNECTQILLNFWYTRFVRKFIDAENLYPKFNQVAKWVEWLLIVFVIAITISIFVQPLSIMPYYLVTAERLFMIVFAVLSNIYVIVNLKDRRGLFIIAGSSVLLAGSVTALVLVDIQYFMIGVVIEILIFAMGLGILMKRREDEKTILSKEMERVKMRALQSQMNPHFIFNSLNSIRSYMIKNETKEASGYLSKFSRLIRQILEYSTEESISLKQELQVLNLYVQIEQLRFRDEFGFDVRVDESIDQELILIPPLIVQPFLENAIWHGLMQKEGAKKIELVIKEEDAYLNITIRDNGIGREEASKSRSGVPKENKSMAIELTNKRLAMLEKASEESPRVHIKDLYHTDGNSAGTEVSFQLPKIIKMTT